MTQLQFFGAAFLAYGPFISMFVLTIANHPVRVIALFSSACFWFLSLLIPSILWSISSGKNKLYWCVIAVVLSQEISRVIMYKCIKKVKARHLKENQYVISYVCGLGFGGMSGAFAFLNALADSRGPGSAGVRGASDACDAYLLYAASLSACVVLLHVCWGVVAFSSLDRKRYHGVAWVVATHLALTTLTLIYGQTDCEWCIVYAILVTAANAIVALHTLGCFRNRGLIPVRENCACD